jgi:hypothetical protein
MTDRLGKHEIRRHATPDEQRKLRLDRVQLETAELERQAALRAAFAPLPADIEILKQINGAGGRIPAIELLTSEARKRNVHELREIGFIDWYGEAGLLHGFEITRQGRALLESIVSRTMPAETPKTASHPLSPPKEKWPREEYARDAIIRLRSDTKAKGNIAAFCREIAAEQGIPEIAASLKKLLYSKTYKSLWQ